MGFRYPQPLKDQLIKRMLAGEDPKQVAASVGNQPSISTLKNWLQEYQSLQWKRITKIDGTAPFYDYVHSPADNKIDPQKINCSSSKYSSITDNKTNFILSEQSGFRTNTSTHTSPKIAIRNEIAPPSQCVQPLTANIASDRIIKRSNDNIENWLDDLLGEDNVCLPLDKKYCCRCGTVISANTEICPECGVNQKECEEHCEIWQRHGYEIKYCYRCGRKIDPLAVECTCCHTQQHVRPASKYSVNWKKLDSLCTDYTPEVNNTSQNNTHTYSVFKLIKNIAIFLFISGLLISFFNAISNNNKQVVQPLPSVSSTTNNTDHTTSRKPSTPVESSTKQVPTPVTTSKRKMTNYWKAENENRCRVKSSENSAMTVTGTSASSLAVEIAMKTDLVIGQRATVRFDSAAPLQVDYSVPLDGMVKLSANPEFIKKMRKSKKISISFTRQDNSKQILEFSLKNFGNACPWVI